MSQGKFKSGAEIWDQIEKNELGPASIAFDKNPQAMMEPQEVGSAAEIGQEGKARADHVHAGVTAVEYDDELIQGIVELLEGANIAYTFDTDERQITIALEDDITLTSVTAEDLTATDDLVVGDDASIGGDLDVTGEVKGGTAKFGGDTHFSEFEADGTLKYNGNATVWEDLRAPSTAINPPGLASDPDWDNTNGGWLFAAGSTEQLWIFFQIPHAWKEGSTIYPHVHWKPTNTNAGNVLWRMDYKWTNINAVDAGAFTRVDILDAGDGSALKHQLADFASQSGSGKTISSMLAILLQRVGGDGSDTYDADALFTEMDIHVELDTPGSRLVSTK